VQPDMDRRGATSLLLEVVERVLDPAEHADVEAWIDVRSEDEGGFLWLVAALGVRPTAIESALRDMIAAPPRERHRLRQRLVKGRRSLNGGAA
jgi:hypothetical protein